MRLPVAVSLESRDGSVSKDAKVVNGVVEARGDQPVLRKRPGTADLGLIAAGQAQLLYSWNGLNAMIGDSLYRGTNATIVSGPSTTAFGPTNTNLRFDAQEVGASAATQLLMVKNKTQAWTVTQSGAKSSVSFPTSLGSSTYPVVSITRSGSTATATLALNPGVGVGDSITVAGAGQSAYNITANVTAVTPYSYSFSSHIPISSLTRAGTTATAVTSSAHGLSSGSYAISGANESAYNGTYSITVVDSTTFTYTVTVKTYTAYGSGVTLNPSDKSSNMALSGGNLTATATTISGNRNASVRAGTGISSGKAVWEVTVSSFVNNVGLGVANSSYSLSGVVGISANSWGEYNNGIFPTTVRGFALDMDAGTLSVYHDGVYQFVVTGITGTVYPAFSSAWAGGTTTAAVTFNFGATPFTYNYDEPVSPATGSPTVFKPESTVNATVSYTVSGTPTTPATGTITLTANGGMVPGLPYIDGYFFVMDDNGVMWASAIDDPTSWNALADLTAQNENGRGKGLGKAQNYLVAFKEWSTEFFYDAKQTPGFPFLPVDNGFTHVGCASGESIAHIDGNLLWLSQVKEDGRSVHMMAGLQQQKISTPDVDRILDADDLATVYAFGARIGGHSFYVLTLVTSNITIVYDLSSQSWTQWTSLTAGSPVSVASITFQGSTATVITATPHGLSDGDPVTMAGAGQNNYNGTFQASYVSSNTFTIPVTGIPVSPATGTITATPYTSSYFKFVKFCDYQGLSLFLHETSGHLYQMLPGYYLDGSVPIDLFFRTARMDGGTTEVKVMSRLTVLADDSSSTLMVRHSDDDCQTFSAYRPVDLSIERPSLRRLGKFRRRTIEGRYIGNGNPRIESLELEVPQ